MSSSFSRFISLILHPLMMPIYMAVIIVFAHPQQFTDTEVIHNDVLLMYFAGITVFIPVFSLFLMRKLEIIASYEINDSKERFIPLIAVGTFWLWGYFMFKEDGLYATSSFYPLGLMLLGCIISLFVLFPLNFVSNNSWHMVGAGGLISMVINIVGTAQYNMVLILIFSILAVGLLASARMTLNKVNKNGMMVGFLIGFFGQFLAFQVWGRIMLG